MTIDLTGQSECDQPNDYIFVSMEKPESAIEKLKKYDEIVIAANNIKIQYNYPFGTFGPSLLERNCGGWIFTETSPTNNGFTRAELVKVISDRYKAIYAEEDAKTEWPVQNIPNMFNRARTNGPYEIWGHYLSDLYLHAVKYDPRGFYTLTLDS